MSQNTQWDSLDYDVLNFPYDRTSHTLSPKPRIVSGLNTYVTRGGAITKRPGTVQLDGNCTVSGRIDRLWVYETMEATPHVYLLASVKQSSLWRLYVKHLEDGVVTPWVMTPAIGGLGLTPGVPSYNPHEVCVSRGLAYVKSNLLDPFDPTDKLGARIFDGTGGTFVQKRWGLLGPTVPARVKGAKTTLTADVSLTATTINVTTSAGFPAAPFDIQVGYEQMTVTVVAGNVLTVTRGANATTVATHLDGESVIWLGWSPSDHLVEVNRGWKYTYAYKTVSGHISNRADLETNPDKLPSDTGPFFDMVPQITVQGNGDTVNVTKICIYRTTDGGGTFFKLEEINNPGFGEVTYYDDSLESGTGGGTYNDPVPDSHLDTFDIAPSMVSNSPPPTTVAPGITGVGAIKPYTPIANFQSRLWYGIDNILFFSAQEELNEGIPEESFPSGAQNGRAGNFYRLQYPITNVVATTNALYIFTPQCTYRLTGNNLETFNINTAFENIGMSNDQRTAVTRFNETIVFLTQDYRIAWIKEDRLEFISDPLKRDLVNAIEAGGTVDVEYFGDTVQNWIVVDVHNVADTTLSRQFIYDLDKSTETREHFWFTPWTIRSVATLASRNTDANSRRHLMFAVYDGTDSSIVVLDTDARTMSDDFLGNINGYSMTLDVHQMRVPAGNHVNGLRAPGATPTVYGVTLDRLKFTSDTDPSVYWFFDDAWTTPVTADAALVPQRRDPSIGFKTNHFTIHRVCQQFSLRISKASSTEDFELNRLTVIWDPDAGA